jgi:pimeloyl-ACP methyl ester carboxylesterase
MEDGTTVPTVESWERSGRHRELRGFEIFTIELGPPEPADREPLLVIHGFPTCSYDFRFVAARLATTRRVLLLDLPGFGLSEKCDIRYSVELHADVVAAFVSETGLGRVALLTHDMGDTVGGELLARSLDGQWPVEVTRRVLTNGSIYIEMAQLTDGQKLLLSLPDLEMEQGPDKASLQAALAATMAVGSTAARDDVAGDAELILRSGGNRLLARTIRYIEDRRRAESRYTGAIESHPSPLGVVWGSEDPIAVRAMTDKLVERSPDATVRLLAGIGHYPMLEAPQSFVAAVEELLDSP